MSRTKMRKSSREKLEKMTPQERSKAVRGITCRETMIDANWVFANDTMADVLDACDNRSPEEQKSALVRS